MIIPVLEGLTLTKGTVGGSDAIIFPDLDATKDVAAEQVALLCDRRRGIGADALMRIVRTHNPSEWRLDVWDADGHRTEPGVLIWLAAHYLRVSGLVALDDGDSLAFGSSWVTRSGSAYATVLPGSGPSSSDGAEQGFDVAVTLDGVEGMKGGLTIGRESVVVAVEHEDEFRAATGSAKFDPVPAAQTVVLLHPDGDTTILDFDGVERPVTAVQVRAFARGRELYSHLTSARDAVVALHGWAGETATGIYHVDNHGYRIEVRMIGNECEMSGTAEIVAEFMLTGIAGEGR
ncbi:diaminopimelate epimerase [Flaviflexus equikiangi]|uniref:Uncharacterized protein n=1 Tax=Flaviflexus equikiangi TaxID=2758573 RepID=A0ABS2TEP8_9ACTO|nr:hypothetical protein [Flaviflexus equikiangi]MBM9433131.1 hypothetical protein [Flaviflexus equikiangi]